MTWRPYAIVFLCSLLATGSLAQSPRNLGNTETPGSVRCVSPDGLSYESCGGAGGAGGDGAINDGVSSSLKATVKDYTNSNPLAVVTVDTNGDPVSPGGGGLTDAQLRATPVPISAAQFGAWGVNADISEWSNVTLAVPYDLDTGGGVENVVGFSLRKAASGGSVDFGTLTDPLRIDPTGTTPQPVTGTFFQATQPVSGTVAATQSGIWTVQPGNTPNSTPWVTESIKVSSANNTGACPSGSANTTALASNASRRAAFLAASSANTDDIFLKLGTTATTANFRLAPGQAFNLLGNSIYTGIIDFLPASGTQAVCVAELN